MNEIKVDVKITRTNGTIKFKHEYFGTIDKIKKFSASLVDIAIKDDCELNAFQDSEIQSIFFTLDKNKDHPNFGDTMTATFAGDEDQTIASEAYALYLDKTNQRTETISDGGVTYQGETK